MIGDKLPYATVDYAALCRFLESSGWREQEDKWYAANERESRHSHHIEWWNRGADAILVYVLDGQASVFGALKIARLNSTIRGK